MVSRSERAIEMSNEIILVGGIIIGALTVPAILSAIKDGGAPRVPAFSATVSGAMIMYAIYNQPGGYTLEEIPDIFARVFGLSI